MTAQHFIHNLNSYFAQNFCQSPSTMYIQNASTKHEVTKLAGYGE